MISEEGFVKIIDLVPISFPKLSRYNKFNKLYKFISCILLLDICIKILLSFTSTQIVDAKSFVHQLNLFSCDVSNMANIWFILISIQEYPFWYEDLKVFDLSISFRTSTKSCFLAIILFYGTVISFVGLITWWKMENEIFFFNALMNVFTYLQIPGLKFILAKRLRSIERDFRENEVDVLKYVLHTRVLMNWNQSINACYSSRVLTSSLNGLLTLLNSLTAYWKLYGLQSEIDCFELRCPLIAWVVQGRVVMDTLFIVAGSSYLSASVSMLDKCFSLK